MIVEAVGVAVHSSNPDTQKRLEEALVVAIAAAQAEGITDPEIIRQRVHAARDVILGA